MEPFYLYLIIGALVVFIFGMNLGVTSNRVIISGGGDEQGRTGNSLFTFLFAIGFVILILYLLLPEEFWATSIMNDRMNAESFHTEELLSESPATKTESLTPVPPLPETDVYFDFTEINDMITEDPLPQNSQPPKVSSHIIRSKVVQLNFYVKEENAIAFSKTLADVYPIIIVRTQKGYSVGYGPFTMEEAEATKQSIREKSIIKHFEFE